MTKVLVIEDDSALLRLYEKLFKLEGMEAELADNGLAAKEILPHFQPDILLLDIMMPTINGLELLGELKADDSTKNIPVVILTNVSDANVTHMALEKGAVMVLIKSETEPEQVVAAIKGVLDKSTPDGEPQA